MAFCGKCGTQVAEGIKFCPSCGAAMGMSAPQQAAAPQQTYQQQAAHQQPNAFQKLNNTPDLTGDFSQQDIEQNKVMALLSYLGILVLVPWFAAPNSKFARFHAKQGANLCIVYIAYAVLSAILSAVIKVEAQWYGVPLGYKVTPGWLSFLLFLIGVPLYILSVLGILNALKGKAKELPIIGKWKILK